MVAKPPQMDIKQSLVNGMLLILLKIDIFKMYFVYSQDLVSIPDPGHQNTAAVVNGELLSGVLVLGFVWFRDPRQNE